MAPLLLPSVEKIRSWSSVTGPLRRHGGFCGNIRKAVHNARHGRTWRFFLWHVERSVGKKDSGDSHSAGCYADPVCRRLFRCCEFFAPRNPYNRFFYGILAPIFIPLFGAFFSGKKEAYEYLVNSIKRFLPVKDFCRMAAECGFRVEKVKGFNGGISYGVFLRKPLEASCG